MSASSPDSGPKHAHVGRHDPIALATEVLERGGLIGLPTETVYGLGADASNPAAVARIFAAKQRPANHPLIVHIHNPAQVNEWAREIPPLAWQLAESFWPGPLTMILRRAAHVLDAVTGGLDTIALRIPDHPIALDLLKQFGRGIAAPSANRHGRVSPTSADHVREELGAAVDLVLDGGPCRIGIESTIVDLSLGELGMLRPGAVTRKDLLALTGASTLGQKMGAVRSPGMLHSHYAPRAQVIPTSAQDVAQHLDRWSKRACRIGLLSPQPPPVGFEDVAWLRLGETASTQAHELFGKLRQADHLRLDVLLAVLPEDDGMGHALCDRLWRAAGPGWEALPITESASDEPASS